MPEPIPESVAALAWNVAPESLDINRSAKLIMQVVLSRGEFEEAQWLLAIYGRGRVGDYVLADIHGPRQLPRASRELWAALLCPQVPRADLEDPPGSRWGKARRRPGGRDAHRPQTGHGSTPGVA